MNAPPAPTIVTAAMPRFDRLRAPLRTRRRTACRAPSPSVRHSRTGHAGRRPGRGTVSRWLMTRLDGIHRASGPILRRGCLPRRPRRPRGPTENANESDAERPLPAWLARPWVVRRSAVQQRAGPLVGPPQARRLADPQAMPMSTRTRLTSRPAALGPVPALPGARPIDWQPVSPSLKPGRPSRPSPSPERPRGPRKTTSSHHRSRSRPSTSSSRRKVTPRRRHRRVVRRVAA